MASFKRSRLFLLVALSLALLFQPLLASVLQATPALAQSASDEPENGFVSPEDQQPQNISSDDDSIIDLGWIFQVNDHLIVSPQDKNAIEQGNVDVRTTDYLTYLVKPVEAGGAGIDRIKTQRIIKNYSSDGVGKLDRETLSALEENNSAVSAHHTGQAVDISEAGAITCKAVERRHIGGSTTHWQDPKPVLVAWQTKDGIARHPTPKGPSLTELSGTMSAESILQMLNTTGEMDQYADLIKGLSLPDMLTYVGSNMLLKEFGSTKITSDPMADSIINILGASMLQKAVPGLPDGLPIGANGDDVRVAVAKAHIEDLLGLAPGSLRGNGWQEILSSAGKRALENAIGVPALYLDSHTLQQLNGLDVAKAALDHLSRGDDAFAVLSGTLDKIKKNDTQGLVWAGVNILEDAFRLNSDQKQVLETAVKKNTNPILSIESLALDKEIPIDSLVNLFSADRNDQQKGVDSLKQYGISYLQQALVKAVPNQYQGITQALLDSLISPNGTINWGSLKEQLGLKQLAAQIDLSDKDLTSITQGKPSSKVLQALAQLINQDFDLGGGTTISATDIQSIFNKDVTVLKKIGGAEADKAIGWAPGTGFALINGDKKLDTALQEVFAGSIGNILGLDKGTFIPLDGDLYGNYGDALVEQRLGLPSGSLKGKANSADINQAELYKAFQINDSRSLNALRQDSAFWTSPTNVQKWQNIDIRLGLPTGTTGRFLQGDVAPNDLAKKTATSNIADIGIDKLWSYFDISDQFRLTKDEGKLLIDVLHDWDKASSDKKQQVLQLTLKLVGRSLDEKTSFALDTFLAMAQSKDPQKITGILIDQGIRQLAGALGLSLKDFSEDDLNAMAQRIINVFNGKSNRGDEQILIDQILQATGIPKEFKADAENFLKGDYRLALEHWSSAMWQNFANKFLPADGLLSYTELRNAILFDDQTAINHAGLDLYNQELGSNISYDQFVGLPDSQKKPYQNEGRKQIMQENRDGAKYKISDAFLHQAGIPIPKDFSKIMFTGSDKDRAELLTGAVFAYLDLEFLKIDGSYQPGTLQKIFTGKLSGAQTDQLILSIIGKAGISIGPFSTEFVQNFYKFVKAQNRDDFFTNSQYTGMWNYLDNWLSSTLHLDGLPSGFGKSIYYASQHNWDFNKGLTVNGQTIVPSIAELGTSFVVNRITNWADKAMGLPSGSVYQLYQAANGVITASHALAAANASGNIAAHSQAASQLKNAQTNLTVLAITIALNACAACQQFFASVDQAIAAPPGFTNALVAGAIAMAFGLGPAGLIIAAAIYLFGVYRVDYLCPIPPKDNYMVSGFDNDYDVLDYKWGDYYDDPTHLVKDNPKPGENPFDWDDGLPFTNGNDPLLWMAWARYFTGRLLDKTMDYGARQDDTRNKPLQVITYRQANVEFFGPRSEATFGAKEKDNSHVGLGYTQKSTKTTDWVHAAFGGFF